MADTQWGRNFFINAASAGCFHLTAEAITTVDGEHVGYLCPDCDRTLAAGWRAADHPADDCPVRVEVTGIADREPQYVHGNCAPTAASR